jgi:DNA-binding IclR family transcriptional regulator
VVNNVFKPVQSLQRGLKLLEVISSRRDGVILKDLAESLGCSSAATYHLVHTLADAGFVRRLEDPVRYVLGEKLLQIVGNQQNDKFYSVAHDCILRLHRVLPEVSIYLSEFIGGSVLVTARLLPDISQHIVRETRPPALPAYCSAGSLCHYAFWSPEAREEYHFRYSFAAYGIPFWGSEKNFEKAVSQLRRDRMYRMPKAGETNVKLALPLFYPEGGMASALTLQWNSANSLDVEKRKALLAAKAAWISEQFTENLAL